MAKQDLVFQPDFQRIKEGLKQFHKDTHYPMEITLANGTPMTFASYVGYHKFISTMCDYYRKTGHKHPLVH